VQEGPPSVLNQPCHGLSRLDRAGPAKVQEGLMPLRTIPPSLCWCRCVLQSRSLIEGDWETQNHNLQVIDRTYAVV